MRTDKLSEAIEWIEQNPHKHDQRVWVGQRTDWHAEQVAESTGAPIHECGTAYCLAGVIVALNDGDDALIWSKRFFPEQFGWERESTVVTETRCGRGGTVSGRATEILEVEDPDDFDIVRLFSANATLAELRTVLANHEEEVTSV